MLLLEEKSREWWQNVILGMNNFILGLDGPFHPNVLDLFRNLVQQLES
jgi:hypothetical protein